METLESLVRFLGSYPLWAKLLAVGGVLTTAATLALAPRVSPKADLQRNSADATDTVFLKILRVKLFSVDLFLTSDESLKLMIRAGASASRLTAVE